MTNPTEAKRQFTPQQKAEAVELCLSENLSCSAGAKRLGIHPRCRTTRVRQARIDRADIGPQLQGLLTRDERVELARLRKENRELRREKDFQAGGSAFCKGAAAAERFRLIETLSDRFSVAWLCQQLGVARSGFYAWRQRQQKPGPRAQQNAAIMIEVSAVFERHHGLYGAPRIHQELMVAGQQVGRNRMARLLRMAVLKAKTRRGFRPCRNSGQKASGVAENLLQHEFMPPAPNRCRAGDITYIRTSNGWSSLAVWIDIYPAGGRMGHG